MHSPHVGTREAAILGWGGAGGGILPGPSWGVCICETAAMGFFKRSRVALASVAQ